MDFESVPCECSPKTEDCQKSGRYGNPTYGCPLTFSLSDLITQWAYNLKSDIRNKDHVWVQQRGLSFNQADLINAST